MAETEQLRFSQTPPEKPDISFSIWPPSHSTRDAVVNHLIGTLSSPSVLSNRYGSISAAEASATARLIEEQAFSAASSSSPGASSTDETGIDVLQAYSKEISKRVIEAIKSKGAPDNAATREQVSSLSNESS